GREARGASDEQAWWKAAGIDPVKVARQLWRQTRLDDGKERHQASDLAARPETPSIASAPDGTREPRPDQVAIGAMDRPVMRAAERDGEFVARFAAERPWLQVTKMMRIGLFAAAEEACLLSDVAQVLSVAIAARCGNREDALINASGLITSGIGCLQLRLRRDV